MNWLEHIESNPNLMFGKPVIKGTRIPVDLIFEKLSLGESINQLLKAYTGIEEEAILAYLAITAESVRNEIVISYVNQ